MKILIVTQRLDKDDPNLGFFMGWIDEFSKNCDITAIETTYKKSLIKRIFNFWYWIRTTNYDLVFVHMTPIWVVIGWPIWFLRRKPIYLWYESRGTRWPLYVALWMVRKVFSASEYGMPLKTSKSVITGHGIDIKHFSFSDDSRLPSLITVGRNSPAKNISVLIGCAKELKEPLDTITDCPHDLLSSILQRSSIFLHASTTGLDKAPLEAMACGCIVVSSSPAFRNILPPECVCSEDMVSTVLHILNMPLEEQNALRRKLREIVIKDHSLPRLIKKLVSSMS